MKGKSVLSSIAEGVYVVGLVSIGNVFYGID